MAAKMDSMGGNMDSKLRFGICKCVQPQEIKDIKKFLEYARRKDAKCQ